MKCFDVKIHCFYLPANFPAVLSDSKLDQTDRFYSYKKNFYKSFYVVWKRKEIKKLYKKSDE